MHDSRSSCSKRNTRYFTDDSADIFRSIDSKGSVLRVRSCTTIYQNIIRPFSILSTNTFKVRRHWKYTETFPSALTTWHFRGFGTEPEIPALPIVARRNRKSLQLTEQRACYSLIDVRKRPIRVTIRQALFFETNELA